MNEHATDTDHANPDGNPPADETDEADELCLRCLAPNQPGTHFCHDCGCPLSSFAATAPFESLFAEGHLYRQAVAQPRRPITLWGMWLIFGLSANTGIALAIGFQDELPAQITGLLTTLFSVVILTKTTRSYLRLRNQAAQTPTSRD